MSYSKEKVINQIHGDGLKNVAKVISGTSIECTIVTTVVIPEICAAILIIMYQTESAVNWYRLIFCLIIVTAP